jgi:DedD protein
METRIKERLAGAIALVAIVVIVVPELLTGPRPPPAGPASAPTAVPTHIVIFDPTNAERGAIQSAPAPAARPDPAAAPSSAPEADATPSTPDAASGPAAERAPSPAPTAAPSAPAATPAPAPSVAAAPAEAPRPLAHAASAWVVQLGSFVSRENAEKLAALLRSKGYSAFVAEFRGSGRVLYRVRVGPEQDRARADAIAARLARDGHRGSVAPEP